MKSAIGFVAGLLLAIAVVSAASAASTCHRLGAAYRNDVDATAEALGTYQHCLSAKRNQAGCVADFLAFRAAQEGLQGSFSSYAKFCVDRLT